MSQKRIKRPKKFLKELGNLKEATENMIQYLEKFNDIETIEKLLGRSLSGEEKRYINNIVKKGVKEVLSE